VLNLAGFFFVTKALAINAVVRVNAVQNLLSTG
jgi:hypothetical protein